MPDQSRVFNVPAEFSIADSRLDDGAFLLTVTGELDIATVSLVRDRLAALADAGACRIVADLRGVSFIDSTGLAAFVHAKVRQGEDGITLVMESDSYARLIFEVAGLVDVIDVVDTLDAALQRG
jgi:anti-anti-sigma factor